MAVVQSARAARVPSGCVLPGTRAVTASVFMTVPLRGQNSQNETTISLGHIDSTL